MPSFSSSLEKSIHSALKLANERNHELATLEHLLLALIDEKDASNVLNGEAMDAEMSGDTTTATTKRNEATTKYNEAKTALLAL